MKQVFGRSRGFTIVELVIVIVVIAILAAITIVAYNGIGMRAAQSLLISDISQASRQLEVFKVDSNGYPTTNSFVSAGIKRNELTTFEYTSDGSSYCLTASSVKARKSYFINSNGAVTEGKCPLHIGYLSPQADTQVTTFAGSGTGGYVNGTGATAQFNGPTGIVQDISGNFYVSDYNTHRIRKIASDGTVSLFAGSGTGGVADGTGAVAQFTNPIGLVIVSGGNMYVGDTYSARVRMITPAGLVTTLAGSSYGYVDGTGSAARFWTPIGIGSDSLGNLYVADRDSSLIRKVTPGGVVTTFAGSTTAGRVDANGTSARFNAPYAIAVDSLNNVYIVDEGNHSIRKITPIGDVTTVAGTGVSGFNNGAASTATFNYPWGIALDGAGNLYIADRQNFVIRKITPAGQVSTYAGTGVAGFADGPGRQAQFASPNSLTVDPSGNLYVTDYGNNRIRKITPYQ